MKHIKVTDKNTNKNYWVICFNNTITNQQDYFLHEYNQISAINGDMIEITEEILNSVFYNDESTTQLRELSKIWEEQLCKEVGCTNGCDERMELLKNFIIELGLPQ